MNENEWAASVRNRVDAFLKKNSPTLEIFQGRQLPYTSEVLFYAEKEPAEHRVISYETDLLVIENLGAGMEAPRRDRGQVRKHHNS